MEKRYFDVDGMPAVISGPMALKGMPDGMFAAVPPSSIWAEGKEISREAFGELKARVVAELERKKTQANKG